MNRPFQLLLFLMVLVVLPAISVKAQATNDTFYPGQLWVQLDPALTKHIESNRKAVNKQQFIESIGKEIAEEMGIDNVEKPFFFARTTEISEVYHLFLESTGNEDQLARLLEKSLAVKYAERVPVMRPTFSPNDLGPASGSGNQWGLWKINALDAWDFTSGNPDITVAIVDDAILVSHPDLIPNLVSGYDVADDDNDPMPNEVAMAHGTHVAGIVGAATNNSTGVSSIGFGIKIMPVKSSNVPETITDAYSGVIWAADNGADVINMSWGGSGFSTTGQNIINYAHDAGCVNVAATGNDNISEVFYPAGYENVLSVSSTTSSDTKSDFSNYGSWVDVSAPGSQILSTYIGNGFAPAYANNSGTSMASPMVAGLAGLVLSVNPDLPQEQVIDCIVNTTQNITALNPGYIGQLGSGRIDAHQAVLCAQATVNAPPVAVINSDNEVACPGGLVQFFANSTGGPGTAFEWSFPGGNPSTSIEQNPVVSYAAIGQYDVSLTITNDFGTDDILMSNYIEISESGTDVFFYEDFESGTFSANGWSIENPDDAMSWEITTVGGTESGNKAARMNLFSYNAQGQRDGLVSPSMNFSSHNNVILTFDHAHRRYSADYSDSLIVMVSTDGGATFPHRILETAENGSGTFATGTLLNQNFIPSTTSDWCYAGDVGTSCFELDLSQFDGETDVKIKFETYNDFGNNLYIDNVQLSGNCLLVEAAPLADFTSTSQAICTGEAIQFFDQSLNIPLVYEWVFEGGTPAASTLAAPSVTYNTPGNYTVSLQVTNLFGSDIIMFEDYITVSEPPLISVEATEMTVCAGEPAILSASGADDYSWSPDIGLSSTTGAIVEASPAASLTYTVTATANGCSAEENVSVDVLPAPTDPEVIADGETTFTVLTPSEVSGHYYYSSTSSANGWGNPDLSLLSIEAPLVIGRDGTAADSLLCNPAVNSDELAGKIAVIYRGGCEFGAKAFQAQSAGAAGVIIINNEAGVPIVMGPGAQGAMVNIPVIMVSLETGAWLNEAINNGSATAVLGMFNGGEFIFCPGDSVRLAAPGGWNQYEWSNGSNSGVVTISDPGDHLVEVFAENGCSSASDSYTVAWFPVTQPIIEPDGADALAVNNISAGSYTWYFNGEMISGENGNTILSQGPGTYEVEITDENGCTAISEPYEIVISSVSDLSVDEINVFPVPANNQVTFTWTSATTSFLKIIASDGREVYHHQELEAGQKQLSVNINDWSAGIYMLNLSDGKNIIYKKFVKVN